MKTIRDYLHIKLAQIAGMYQAPVFGNEQPGTSMNQDPMQQTLAQMKGYQTAQNRRVSSFKKMVKTRAAMQQVNPNAANVLAPTPMVQRTEQATTYVMPEASLNKAASFAPSRDEMDAYHAARAREWLADKKQLADVKARRAHLGGATAFGSPERAAKKALLRAQAGELKKNIGSSALPGFLGASEAKTKDYTKKFWQAKYNPTDTNAAAAAEAAKSSMNKSKWLRRGGLAAGAAGAYLGYRALKKKMRKDFWGPPPEQQQQQQAPQQMGTSGSGSWVNDQFGGGGSQMPVVKTGAELIMKPKGLPKPLKANIGGPDLDVSGQRARAAPGMIYRPRKMFT